MTNEFVDTTSKERRRQVYHITLLPHHDARPNLITGKLRVTLLLHFNYSHILPINYRYGSSNKSTKYERWRCGAKITDNFCYTRSATLEAIYVLP